MTFKTPQPGTKYARRKTARAVPPFDVVRVDYVDENRVYVYPENEDSLPWYNQRRRAYRFEYFARTYTPLTD